MCGLQSELSKQRSSASSVNLLRRMASTKKTGFIAESKSVSEKKRRKSDLVVMWITLWDVILYAATEMWMTLKAFLEVGKLFFNSDEHWQIREWLEEHLPQVPDDFSHSWRDGILFCKLLNKLQPGCYPDANILDTNFGVRNLAKAFHILETRFDIIPKVTVEEIVACSKDSELKLVDLLVRLKQKTDDRENNNEVKSAAEEKENVPENGTTETENCIAKGTGLVVGFVGRAASFGVFFSTLSDLNLVVEIRGPSNTICSERVTKRSPKKKKVINPWKPLSPHAFVRSSSNEEIKTSTIDGSQELPTEIEKCVIPLEYEINSNQISFAYFPLIQGEHRIAVLSHGQHVSDSPYLVTVEPSVRVSRIENMAHIKSVLKPPRSCEKNVEEEPKKSTVRFQEPSERKERLGKILKRQVLRYIVKIDSKDVVVDTDSIDNLATSLLKMDYELQKRPLIRRNSWGFVGDAERKISVIRQFGIDLVELEAQSIKMHRSNSLSLSPITKKPPKLSTSYECEDIIQQKILETVTEGKVAHFCNSSVSHEEEEDAFALMNEDFYSFSDENIEGVADEQKDFVSNSLKNSGDNMSEKTFCVNNFRELDQISSTTQAQILLKSVITDTKNLISSVGVPEDHLSSLSECSSRLGIQLDEELVLQKAETKTKTISPDSNKNSQTTELFSTYDNNMIVGESGQDFKDLEAADNVFVEEMPCRKTDAKSVSNHACNKIMFQLLDTSKPELSKYENSKKLTRKRNMLSKREDYISQTKEINNSRNNSQCKYSKKATSCEGNLNYFIKSKHLINEKFKSKNIDIPKIRFKSFAYSNVKRNKSKGARLNKYQFDSYYTKRRRSSSQSLIENPLLKKLQSVLQNIDYEDISSMSKMASLKSTKYRNISDPTYNSFNRNECTNLEYSQNKNVLHETKYENRVGIGKYKSNSTSKETIQVVNNASSNNDKETSSYLSNIGLKPSINRNEIGIKIWPDSLKAEIEPQHMRKNFNIYHHPKNEYVSTKHSMIYEPLSASVVDSASNHSSESFVKNNYDSSKESSPVKNSILKNTCQFTYKHFNPPFQFDRENPVKKQIMLWEASTIQRNDKPVSKCMEKLHVLPELVDIKSKLKFWENAYHHSENEELKGRKISKISEDVFKKEERSDTSKSLTSGTIFGENHEKQKQVLLHQVSKEETNINNSTSLEKSVDCKMLKMDSTRAKKRSFSDPCVLDKPDNGMEDNTLPLEYINENIKPASSKDELSSSNDGNFIELFADDEYSSMDLLCSTEDEYIDDEISENISTYWGDLSLMKGIKTYDSSEYEEFLHLMNSESLLSCADECKFFGIATYFGHVAVKNRFWVLTKGAGRGNLSASVQGIGQHNVAFVSVEYTRKDIYEVTYQVFIPGLYLISVRWMDTPIPGSPYLCKVTF